MNTLEKNIETASQMCTTGIWPDSEYSRIYTFTTENISDYLKHFQLKNKSLLTVGSSGDQVLNAFYHGARDITLFDINPYAKYYTYLKIAAIISLTYTEFKVFFFKHGEKIYYNRHMFNKKLYQKLAPTLRMLDYESFLFFDEIFNTFTPNEIRDSLFNDDELRNKVIKGFNIYLRDEESYNKLKEIIRGISFQYIHGDIYKDEIPGTYDNIFLSNISNAAKFPEYKAMLEKVTQANLTSTGSAQIAYLWDIYFDETYYEKDWFEIYKMPIVKEEIGHLITEAQDVLSARDILWQEKRKRDLILIHRK